MNIAIITANDIYRDSLKTVLNQIPQFKVTLVCRNRKDALIQIVGRMIDVVLLDSAEYDDEPEGFIKQIHRLSPKAKIVMLLDQSEECWYTQAINSGADDAVPQHTDKNVLEEHMRRLSHGHSKKRKKGNIISNK